MHRLVQCKRFLRVLFKVLKGAVFYLFKKIRQFLGLFLRPFKKLFGRCFKHQKKHATHVEPVAEVSSSENSFMIERLDIPPIDEKKVTDEEFQKKAFAIQRSTKTLVGKMFPIHEFFRLNLKWYYNWHTKSYSRKVHWATLALYVISITSLLFFTMMPSQKLKANNYSKIWTSTGDFNSGTKSNIDTLSDQAKLATSTSNFTEDFTGTTYKDPATTANWDTSLTLPGDLVNGTATDLEAKWKAAIGTSESISSLVYDTTNHIIYLGGSTKNFGAYDPVSQTVYDLTSKISATWGAAGIMALTFDSTNGYVYLGGTSGRFGAFIGGNNPANGTWTYLNSKISADWAGNLVTTLTFDSTNGYVYVGGYGGKFGAFLGGNNPGAGTWTHLSAKITADWSTASVNALTFDSTNGYVYLGGTSGRFGAFIGGNNPANGTWTYLNSKISANWGTNSVSALTFDSFNGFIYLGGAGGKFGAISASATPASATWTYLLSNLGIGNTFINCLTYDSTNRIVYVGAENAYFRSFQGGANPSGSTAIDLNSKISAQFGAAGPSSTSVSAAIFDSANASVYIAGTYKAGKFQGGANPANGTWTYLSDSMSALLAGTDIIASGYDSINGYLYLGSISGDFAAYNVSNGTMVNLTAKISSNWGVNQFDYITFDSTNGYIYISGVNGRFGAFLGGNNPANGTFTYLSPKISADWANSAIAALTFDSTNGYIYLAGAGGKFGAFLGGSDPANGTWVYLTTKISANWSTVIINSLTFDSTNGFIYLGGGSGRFGAFLGGNDPANGTWTYLNAKITADWSTSSVLALAFDAATGYIYLGGSHLGASARFGAFLGGNDPTNGTWTNLYAKTSGDWNSQSINSLAISDGKVYLAGTASHFGVFVGGSNPSAGTWNYLYSKISSFFGTNIIYTLCSVPSLSAVFVSAVTGEFASYQVGYSTNKDGVSLKVNGAETILKATLTATENKPENTNIVYYLSNNGGTNWYEVTSGNEYTFAAAGADLRWKANLTTTDLKVTPTISNIAISYKYYTASSGSLNLQFDAEQSVAWMALNWNHTLPANTSLNFKIKGAATQVGLAEATWSEVKAANTAPVNLRTINFDGVPGMEDSQWAEVQIDFATTDNFNTPVLQDLTLNYVINRPPEVQAFTVSQALDGAKMVNANFEVRDPDTSINPYNPNQVDVSLKYSLDNGENWLDAVTTTGTGLIGVDTTVFLPKTVSWNVGTDLPDTYRDNDIKVKLVVNDNEQAHNLSETDSGTFSIDTKNPIAGAIAGGFTGVKIGDGSDWTNDSTVDLTLSATDDTALQMWISNDGFATGSYEPYAASKAAWPLSANDGNKTVSVKFKDAFGNTTTSTSNVLLDTTAPGVPANVRIYDTSEESLERYSLTIIWDSVPLVLDFNNYVVERSTNGADYVQITTIGQTVFTDVNLSNDQTYSYRIRSTDNHNNQSAASSVVAMQPTSQDITPPQITGGAPSVEPSDVTARITWRTDESADSYIEFGTTTSYGFIQGSNDMVTDHDITIIGLQALTNYHYRIRSKDSAGNLAITSDYTFLTTLPTESNGEVAITGATAQRAGADPEEVTIIWTTDRYATSQVFYGKTENLGSQTDEDPTMNKAHYVNISHLDPNTKYYYKVRSKDSYGNVTLSEVKYFVTSQSGVTEASILNTEVSDVTMTSAIISWETTIVTTSKLDYGESTKYGETVSDYSTGATTKHVVRLKDLKMGTKYHFRVSGMTNLNTAIASDDYNFSTIALPVISEVNITNVSSLSADVTWKTNTQTDSFVEILGASENTQGSTDLTTDHKVSLKGLVAGSSYNIKIKARDAYSNQAVSDSFSFVTKIDTAPPKISDIKSETNLINDRATGQLSVQAIVSWNTDEPSSSQVQYSKGTSATGGYENQTQVNSSLSTSHVVIIPGLLPSTTYHFQIISKDSSNNTGNSGDYTILTNRQETSFLQVVVGVLEDTFGWVKKLKIFGGS